MKPYEFVTKEDTNCLCAKWNCGGDYEPEAFGEALNLAERVMKERDAFKKVATEMAKAKGTMMGLSRSDESWKIWVEAEARKLLEKGE